MRDLRDCPICGNNHNIHGGGYAWSGGYSYCSEKCYDALFANCKHCGAYTMGECDTYDWYLNQNECMDCYLKTRNLCLVLLDFG